MKKSISILLAAVILLAMTACSSASAEPAVTDPSPEVTETSFMSSGEGEDATQTTEPAELIEPQPELQAEPETPVAPAPEMAKPIVVGESDVLTMNVTYQFDLSGDGELDTFEFIRKDGNWIKFVVNGVNRYFKNIEPELTSNSYRIVDLNPTDPYKDLEILETMPPDEQTIHFIRVKGSGVKARIEYFGPLTVADEDYGNDRVLYQGNDQIMVIEMSKIVTAFYQKFYRLGVESIKDESRSDISRYMNPLRVTLLKDMWGYSTPDAIDATYIPAGEQLLIQGENEGNLWIEYLGEASSEFMWLRGFDIQHYPDEKGNYQFVGVQFWS